jgi:hypothetical protein
MLRNLMINGFSCPSAQRRVYKRLKKQTFASTIFFPPIVKKPPQRQCRDGFFTFAPRAGSRRAVRS